MESRENRRGMLEAGAATNVGTGASLLKTTPCAALTTTMHAAYAVPRRYGRSTQSSFVSVTVVDGQAPASHICRRPAQAISLAGWVVKRTEEITAPAAHLPLLTCMQFARPTRRPCAAVIHE